MQRISVTLPDKVAESFYARVSKGDRSRFIAEAIEDALNKEAKLQAFQSLKRFKPFDVPEESVKTLKKIRTSRQERLAKKGE